MVLSRRLVAIVLFSLLTLNVFAANTKRPTLILIHGALLNSSIWVSVQNYLQNRDYNVVTVDVPGRDNDGIPANEVTLTAAVDKVCKVAKLQSEPVILVGHSQGGAIITQAVAECSPNIKGLVYITAVLPLNGETSFQMLSEQDGKNFDQCATLDEKEGIYKVNYKGPLKEMFMADANPAQAKKSINNMTAEPRYIGEAILHYDEVVFNSIPKFFIKTTQDKIISPETQDRMISRVNIQKIYAIKSSHSPFLTRSHELGVYLAEITDSL